MIRTVPESNSIQPSSNPAPTSYYGLQYKSKTEERETNMKEIARMCVLTPVAVSAIFAAANPMESEIRGEYCRVWRFFCYDSPARR